MNLTLKKTSRKAIEKHGLERVQWAFREHQQGNGAGYISSCLGIHHRSADACIDAGRDLANCQAEQVIVDRPVQSCYEMNLAAAEAWDNRLFKKAV